MIPAERRHLRAVKANDLTPPASVLPADFSLPGSSPFELTRDPVIECPVCLMRYSPVRRAKVGICGHSLCSQCVNKITGKKCPTCNRHNSFQSAVDNYSFIETAEKLIRLENELKTQKRNCDFLRGFEEREKKQRLDAESQLRQRESELDERRRELEEARGRLTESTDHCLRYLTLQMRREHELMLRRIENAEEMEENGVIEKKSERKGKASQCAACSSSLNKDRARVCVACSCEQGSAHKEEDGQLVIDDIDKIESSLLCSDCLLDEHSGHEHAKFLPLKLRIRCDADREKYDRSLAEGIGCVEWKELNDKMKEAADGLKQSLSLALDKASSLSSWDDYLSMDIGALVTRGVRANAALARAIVSYQIECQELSEGLNGLEAKSVSGANTSYVDSLFNSARSSLQPNDLFLPDKNTAVFPVSPSPFASLFSQETIDNYHKEASEEEEEKEEKEALRRMLQKQEEMVKKIASISTAAPAPSL